MDNNQLAIKYIQEQNFEKATELLNEAITNNPTDPLGYVNFGNLLLHMNDKVRAERFFNKAIELNDKTATAYYGLGNIYYEKESYDKAQRNYQQSIDLGLEDGDVYYMLGMSLRMLEQDVLALPYLLRATELNPNDLEALFQYGLTLAQTNYISEAKEIFEKIILSDEHHADAHYNLGVIALFNENAEEGLNHFERALSSQPNHILAANGKKTVLEALEE